MDKVDSSSDTENSYQSSFLLNANSNRLVNPPRHTRQLVMPRLEPIPTIYAPLDDQKADKDASQFDTAPMRIIQRKQAKNKLKTFFTNLMGILLGTLFLGMLVAIIIVITGGVAKIEASIIFLIALSYITSLQIKRIRRARGKNYLTFTQMLQEDNEPPATSKYVDTEHLELIKQDTSTYLHGLIAKDFEKML